MEVACWTVIAVGSAASKADQSTWAENGLPRWSGQVVVSLTAFDTTMPQVARPLDRWTLSIQGVGWWEIGRTKLLKAISIPSIHAEWLQPLDLGKSWPQILTKSDEMMHIILGVSENSGTPKSSISILGKTPYCWISTHIKLLRSCELSATSVTKGSDPQNLPLCQIWSIAKIMSPLTSSSGQVHFGVSGAEFWLPCESKIIWYTLGLLRAIHWLVTDLGDSFEQLVVLRHFHI